MGKVKVFLHPQAEIDYREIGRYTQQEWGVAQRRKYLSALRLKFENIAEYPDIGISRDDIGEGIYYAPCERHMIYYTHSKQYVAIIRILHHSMDPVLKLKAIEP